MWLSRGSRPLVLLTTKSNKTGPFLITHTRSFPRSLQFSQFADLVLGDSRHISPEVHVLALLQLHIHLREQHQPYSYRYKASKNTRPQLHF